MLKEYGSNIFIGGSTFEGNTADLNGGAVYNDYGITVWNSTFKSNTANEYGGAIYGSDAIYINDKHQSSEPISFFIDVRVSFNISVS